MSKWFVRPLSPQARARIFCFPYSGVGASMFARWPQSVDGAQVCPIQFPGRENRLGETHFRSYEELAAGIVDALEPFLDRPFSFFGHCSGALPAFETAALLHARGLPVPDRLVLSAQVAPHDCPFDRLLDLTEAQLRAELATVMVGRGGEVRLALIDLGVRVLRADLVAVASYRRDCPIVVPSPITAVHFADDPEIEEAQLAGWLSYSDNAGVVVVPGGHFDVLDGPSELLRLLRPVHSTT